MSERVHRSGARTGFYTDTQILRLDLYRILCHFFASRNFAELSTGDAAWNPIAELADEFEESEIVRILVATSIYFRIFLDQNSLRGDPSGADSGLLTPDLSKPDQSQTLDLREACNKIIHARDVRFDVDYFDGYKPYLNPELHLYGDKSGVKWKAVIRIVDFVRDINIYLP